MRALFPTILTALAALTIWGCTGGGSNSPNGGERNGDAQVKASCDAIKEIERYRYVFDLKSDAPLVENPSNGTPQPFDEAFQAIWSVASDMSGEGAFVSPDSSSILMRSQADELEIRTIGDRSWLRLGATWQEQEPPDEGALLTPASVCKDEVEGLSPYLAALTGEVEVVNGIETVHYRLDEDDLKKQPALLGTSGQDALPSEFAVDIWLESNEGWPVSVKKTLRYMDEQGNPITFDLFIEFSNINDPAIEINPPPVSPAQT